VATCSTDTRTDASGAVGSRELVGVVAVEVGEVVATGEVVAGVDEHAVTSSTASPTIGPRRPEARDAILT
jgi:hypothetical protein